MPIMQTLESRRKFRDSLPESIQKINGSDDANEIKDTICELLSTLPRGLRYLRLTGPEGIINKVLVSSSNIKEFKEESLKLLEHLEQENAESLAGAEELYAEKQARGDNPSLPRDVAKVLTEGFLKFGAPKTAAAFDEEIEFSHNGGLKFVTDFLANKNSGYNLEGQQCFGGIQVMRIDPSNERTAKPVQNYLEKALYAFDTPVMIKAKVARKYLDDAPNDYEAGIRSCYADKIYDMQIKLCMHLTHPGMREGKKIISDPDLVRSLQKGCKTEFFELTPDAEPQGPTWWTYIDLNPYHAGQYSGLEALDLAVREDQCLLGKDPIVKPDLAE